MTPLKLQCRHGLFNGNLTHVGLMPVLKKELIDEMAAEGISWGFDMCGSINNTEIPTHPKFKHKVPMCHKFIDTAGLREKFIKECKYKSECTLWHLHDFISRNHTESGSCTLDEAYIYLQAQC